MPTNKPMKMQWITVDGRQVPSILPNHWNEQKNDWDITGTKNPLPIANYTQNASGVWLPTSESNPMPTRVTGSIVEEVYYNLSFTGLVDEDDVEVQKTPGFNFDVSRYNRKFISISNHHAISIEARIQLKSRSNRDSYTAVEVLRKTIPTFGTLLIDSSEFPVIDAPSPFLRVNLSRDSEAEEVIGSVRIAIYGGVF